MPEQQRWEEQVRQFWRKTGEDLRRTSTDIRSEAQKLLGTVLEPGRQERMREGLRELSGWARRTADEIARRVETAATQAEAAVEKAASQVSEKAAGTPAAKVVDRAVKTTRKVTKSVRKTVRKGAASRSAKKPPAKPTSPPKGKKKPAARKKTESED